MFCNCCGGEIPVGANVCPICNNPINPTPIQTQDDSSYGMAMDSSTFYNSSNMMQGFQNMQSPYGTAHDQISYSYPIDNTLGIPNKKRKKGLIIGIGVSAVLIITLIILFATGVFGSWRGSLKIEITNSGEFAVGIIDYEVVVKNSKGEYIKSDGTVSEREERLRVISGEPLQIDNIPTGVYSVTEVDSSGESDDYEITITGEDDIEVTKANTEDKPALVNIHNKYSIRTDGTYWLVSISVNGLTIDSSQLKGYGIDGYLNVKGTKVTVTINENSEETDALFENGKVTFTKDGITGTYSFGTITIYEDNSGDKGKTEMVFKKYGSITNSV